MKVEITNTEKALNVCAQVLTPIMMPKISRYIKILRYIEKVDIFFDDTIQCIHI